MTYIYATGQLAVLQYVQPIVEVQAFGSLFRGKVVCWAGWKCTGELVVKEFGWTGVSNMLCFQLL